MRGQGIVVPKKLKFKPLTRKGMSVCADHGWQKKGFDSLTDGGNEIDPDKRFVTIDVSGITGVHLS